MAMGLTVDGAGNYRLRARRLQAGAVNIHHMSEKLWEDLLIEGERMVKEEFRATVGHGTTSAMRGSLPGGYGVTQRTYNAITHTKMSAGSFGKIYVSRTGGGLGPPTNRGYFYPLVFEFGRKKIPAYYGRHFFREGIRKWRRKAKAQARISLRTMKGTL